MRMNEIELKPCPFCGNSAEFLPFKKDGLTLKCKSMGCIRRDQRTLRYGIEWLRGVMAEHWNTRAALTPPEGYVLVPVILTQEMEDAGYPADTAQEGWAAMLAARPEVSP